MEFVKSRTTHAVIVFVLRITAWLKSISAIVEHVRLDVIAENTICKGNESTVCTESTKTSTGARSKSFATRQQTVVVGRSSKDGWTVPKTSTGTGRNTKRDSGSFTENIGSETRTSTF